VYVWADGVHFNIRLEEDRHCILVLMGATPEGDKELIAIREGYRESEQSWKALLLDCKHRGLSLEPEFAIADGVPGRPRASRGRGRTRRVPFRLLSKRALNASIVGARNGKNPTGRFLPVHHKPAVHIDGLPRHIGGPR
jgi:hypothetical protein